MGRIRSRLQVCHRNGRSNFRQEFGRDFVVDMYCYRKYGHQEVDEPSFTQPDLYARIDKRPSVTQIYKTGVCSIAVCLLRMTPRFARDRVFNSGSRWRWNTSRRWKKQNKRANRPKFKESTAVFQSKYSTASKPTAIGEEMLRTIVDGLTRRSGRISYSAESETDADRSAPANF